MTSIHSSFNQFIERKKISSDKSFNSHVEILTTTVQIANIYLGNFVYWSFCAQIVRYNNSSSLSITALILNYDWLRDCLILLILWLNGNLCNLWFWSASDLWIWFLLILVFYNYLYSNKSHMDIGLYNVQITDLFHINYRSSLIINMEVSNMRFMALS